MAVDLGREIVFRGDGADPKLLARFHAAGAAGAAFTKATPEQEEACRKLGLELLRAPEMQSLGWPEIGHAKPGAPVVLAEGLWPGVARGGNRDSDDETASASRQPWVDANGYWVGCLNALAPARPAVLGYRPDEKAGLKKDRVVPFDSLELALVDAWVPGGNCLLDVEPRFRGALAKGDAQANTAWTRFTQTAAWLKKNAAWFRQPTMPTATVLVEPGTESAELVNLMYRHAVSPALASAQAPPPASPGRILALVAASINPPGAEARKRILDHAQQGAAVIVDTPAEKAWWRTAGMKAAKDEEDRVLYKVGKGLLVAYRKPIEDPSEFAFDVIDFVTQKKRAVRIFMAPTVLALATQSRPKEATVLLVNYGSPTRREFIVHVQGLYSGARLERPEAAGVDFKPSRRGSATEILVPEINRVAVVILS